MILFRCVLNDNNARIIRDIESHKITGTQIYFEFSIQFDLNSRENVEFQIYIIST